MGKEEREIIVAAIDSSDEAKKMAGYLCDGIDDQVEIQFVIDTYGVFPKLMPGQYNLSRPILGTEGIYLRGNDVIPNFIPFKESHFYDPNPYDIDEYYKE